MSQAFDPEEWLMVAEVCCSTIPQVSRQALLRTASNRAYYAALLSLKLRIEAAQGSGAVPEWQTHDAIKQAVRTGGEEFKDIPRWLGKLRTLREQADDVLATPEFTWNHVHEMVDRARWLIRNRIKALPEAEFRRLHVRAGDRAGSQHSTPHGRRLGDDSTSHRERLRAAAGRVLHARGA
jgi:hypothetical protein